MELISLNQGKKKLAEEALATCFSVMLACEKVFMFYWKLGSEWPNSANLIVIGSNSRVHETRLPALWRG